MSTKNAVPLNSTFNGTANSATLNTTSGGGTFRPVGGEQSAKAFLDTVMDAVLAEEYGRLRDMQPSFAAVPENIDKCRDSAGNTIAHLAVTKDPTMLRYLVENYGADINATNKLGKTPLHEAVRSNFVETARYILSVPGCIDDVPCNTLSSPFHTAAACGALKCMELLLERCPNRKAREARINEQDKNKTTALLKCTYDGDIEVMRWLIERGADCTARDNCDRTPLLVAAMRGREDIVDELLALGPDRCGDVNERDIDGNTAIHHCAIRCWPRIAAKLIENGGDVLRQNAQRNNALHLAALNPKESPEWRELILVLVRKGGEAALKQENTSRKVPTDLVSRLHRPIFSVAEVRREEERSQQQQASSSSRAAESAVVVTAAIDALRVSQAAIEQARKDEEERCAKEAEERLHHEDNVRSRHEEVIETARREAEEAERLKREAKMKPKGKKA